MKNCSFSKRYSIWSRTIEASRVRAVTWGLLVDSLWLTSAQILSYTHDAAPTRWEAETKTELNLEFYLLDFVQLQLKEQEKKSRNVLFFFGTGSQDTCFAWNVHQKLLAKLVPADKAHKLSFPFILRFGKCENLLRQVQNNDMQSNLRTRTWKSFGRNTGSCTFITLWWTPSVLRVGVGRAGRAQLQLASSAVPSVNLQSIKSSRGESSATRQGIRVGEAGKEYVCLWGSSLRLSFVYLVACAVNVFTPLSTRLDAQANGLITVPVVDVICPIWEAVPGWNHAECVYGTAATFGQKYDIFYDSQLAYLAGSFFLLCSTTKFA